MATVYVGSARIDENGKASGGRAGDQTGKEVSTQVWYKHSKGWRVFRAKSATVAEKIAQDMQWACDNKHIGYDQGGRLTLYNTAKPLGFNCKAVTTDCETDCSALVRVCCAYSGIDLPNFRTPTEPEALLNSGAFVELTGSKYTDQSLYLGRGDILVTRTQGHTVVVLSNGSKFEGTIVKPIEYVLGCRIITYGMEGADVKVMQSMLIELGYDLGRWGADGDFGDATELALKKFQSDAGIDVDGECGPQTIAALNAAIEKLHEIDGCTDSCPLEVRIVNGDCYVRSAPNTDGKKLGVAKRGTVLPYGGQTSEAGWNLVEYKGQNAWVSGKYSEVVR